MAKVLICDDNQAIRRVLTEIIELDKHEAIVAIDGVDALEKIKLNNPDLILLDIKMPKLDGFDVLETLQQLSNKIPIIMISGQSDEVLIEKCKRLGAFDYMMKPFELELFFASVRKALIRNEN